MSEKTDCTQLSESMRARDEPESPTWTNTSGATVGDAIINIPEDRCDSDSDGARSVPEPLPKKSLWPSWLRTRTTHPDVEETETRTLEGTLNGYPRLAAFQCSEDNFGLYRAFDYLHSRTILDLQAELTELEQELEVLDGEDAHPDATAENLEGNDRLKDRAEDLEACHRPNAGRTRVDVLQDIRDKLDEYDRLLVSARAVASFQRPSNRVYRNVRKYIHNTKPLCDADMRSIRCKEDIVTLRQGREWANFDGFVERVLRVVDVHLLQPVFRTEKPPLERILCTPELHKKTTNKFLHYYSSSRINVIVGVLITFVIFVLLIVPVLAMYRLTSFGRQGTTLDAVGVLVVFTLLFSAAMSLLTKASRHELFAASAAYCAILVVFISNLGTYGGRAQ